MSWNNTCVLEGEKQFSNYAAHELRAPVLPLNLSPHKSTKPGHIPAILAGKLAGKTPTCQSLRIACIFTS
jgi:hypothetical protein